MDFIPGYLQGITRVIISHPFDYIRIHLQMNKYKNIRDFFKFNKINNIYKGVQVPLLIVPIDRAIQFKFYEFLNKKNINPFITGGFCGIVSSFINLPSSYIGNNYILQKNNNFKLFVKKVFRHDIKNLFFGYKPELIRSIVASSIYLGVYGNLRNKYGNSVNQSIINGAIAGVTLWTITYPLETIKLEQQTNNNINFVDIYKNRVKKYGYLNLWKGILPIYIRTLPSSIGGMIVYEKTRKILNL